MSWADELQIFHHFEPLQTISFEQHYVIKVCIPTLGRYQLGRIRLRYDYIRHTGDKITRTPHWGVPRSIILELHSCINVNMDSHPKRDYQFDVYQSLTCDLIYHRASDKDVNPQAENA